MRVLAPLAGWPTNLYKCTALMALDAYACRFRSEGLFPPTPGVRSHCSAQSAVGGGHVLTER